MRKSNARAPLYIIQRMLGPLTAEQNDLFLRNPRFVGLKVKQRA